MRFDTGNTGKYFFDDRQTLTNEEWNDFKDAYNTEFHEGVKKTVSSVTREDKERPSFMNPAVLIPIGICAVLVLIGIFTNSMLLWAGGFALIMVYAGVFVLITGGVSKTKPNPSADTASNRFTGLIIALIPIVSFLMWFVFLKDKPTAYKAFLVIGSVLTGLGVLFISRIIFHLTANDRVYPEEINATCIGYARYVEYSVNDGIVNEIPMVSPVFEYSYEGERFTCVYDGFTSSKDSDVGLGPSVIRISPKIPEGIYNRKSQSISALVIMAIISLIIGACLMAIALSGFYTQWKPSTSVDDVVRIVDILD
ncbi:MAG: hypothetical protein K6G47_09675 [Clostridia bacterium]|nr:hypothetical protein [Clostridia bacterium]